MVSIPMNTERKTKMCRDGWDMNRNSEQTIVMTKGRTQREHDEASYIQITIHC